MTSYRRVIYSGEREEERGWKEENKENTRVGEGIADPG